MAGLYFHIPFCKKRCSYCDFFSSTDNDLSGKFIETCLKEIDIKKSFFAGNEIIETIYFGGGTPSFISFIFINKLLEAAYKRFKINSLPEITFEANPDDVSPAAAKQWRKAGINRISLGVQSFDNELLKLLSRRHTSEQALESLKILQDAGFVNISIDLMYGIPGLTEKIWDKALFAALNSASTHISAYHLTLEKNTPLYVYCNNNPAEISEDQSVRQYSMLCNIMKNEGFVHYEISNFSKPSFESNHNNGYWNGENYLGLGPSAHSYNGETRHWNVSGLKKYFNLIQNNKTFFRYEKINKTTKYNEQVLTRLRTKHGISLTDIATRFGPEFAEKFLVQAQKHMAPGNIQKNGGETFVIPEEKWFISDYIISSLLIV